MVTTFKNTLDFAKSLDDQDVLSSFRGMFHFPVQGNGNPYLYFCGNSLGLQPKQTKDYILQELEDWKSFGVEGHFHAKRPWMPYHEFLTNAMAEVVGAKPHEVVVMNTLTVNLHLMMVSFYKPTPQRYKILIEHDAFPSDHYAVASQIKHHGFDPESAIISLKSREGEYCLREEDIMQVIKDYGNEIALILLGNTNYYTGQYFDMKAIASVGHQFGCKVGFDCAHGAGNVPLNLHESGVDFAVWCTYKYLNAGPGSIGACFIHERYAGDIIIDKFTGWWGHNKETRFGMRDSFEPIYGAESWQLSNPPILSMAAVLSSLHLFQKAGIENLRTKSILLTNYMEYLLKEINNENIEIITPKSQNQRGAQLSIRVKDANKTLFDKICDKGIIADWRSPDVIRVAPVPMYNSFEDVFHFTRILKEELKHG